MNITPAELERLRERDASRVASGQTTREALIGLAERPVASPAGYIPGSLLVGPFAAKPKDVVLSCTIAGDPVAKQRPRWAPRSRTTYTPARTRLREEAIAMIAKAAHRELVLDPIGLFSLRAGFYLATNQARDVDNMLKLLLDALTGVVWEDDRQVIEVFGFKVPADRPDEARTEVIVARLPGAMPYGMVKCAACGRQFRTYPSWKFRRFCSRACLAAAQRRRVSVTCAHCHKPFEIQYGLRAAKVFCSRVCKTAAGRTEVVCVVCGKPFVCQASTAKRRQAQTCSRSCAIRLGRGPRPDLTSEAVRALVGYGQSINAVARHFGVSWPTVHRRLRAQPGVEVTVEARGADGPA